MEVDYRQRCVEHLTTDIVEEHVDPVGASARKTSIYVFVLVVNCRVEAQLVREESAFLGSTCDPDGAATLDLGDLAHMSANRASSARHDDGLALLRRADLYKTAVSGQTRDSQRVQIRGQGSQTGIGFHQKTTVRDRVLLHAINSGHQITSGKSRVLARDHLADCKCPHHVAKL